VSTALERRPRDDDDGIRAVGVDARGIWLDTEFPGVRLTCALDVRGQEHAVTMDIGFHDPLVPPPISLVIDGVEVRCVRPETQVAWKLHALAEMGASFRPKDLADLWRITSRVPLDDALLPPAIVAAFESRGYPITDATELFDRPYWDTKSARVRWTPNRSGPGVPALPKALAEVRERLRVALEACSLKPMG
jgi:hypothetical protein